MCNEVGLLFSEIKYYLTRIVPRGNEDADRLGFIIDTLEEHESCQRVKRDAGTSQIF